MSESSTKTTAQRIVAEIERARTQMPAYREMYPFLEGLFLTQLVAMESIRLSAPAGSTGLIQSKWAEGFPVLQRWEFPIDVLSAETVLRHIKDSVLSLTEAIKDCCAVLVKLLDLASEDAKVAAWRTFLLHDRQPWMVPEESSKVDLNSLLFLARSCLHPSIETYAQALWSKAPLTGSWQKGYCPICGSLPSLLLLQGEGERRAHCSWCATHWELSRLQCPYCDNRSHESMGYLHMEEGAVYRIQYCRRCSHYFKLIDTRELLDFPYLPLEEWKTLHLDLIAQREGWMQPPSPSPVVYPEVAG